MASTAVWIEQFLGLYCLTEIISTHWLSEKSERKTNRGCRGYLLPWSSRAEPNSMLQSAGEGMESGKKLARGPERGLGSQMAAMETSLLTSSAPQGDPWLQPVCLGELSLAAAFLPSSSQTGTRELAGERASGDEQRQHSGGTVSACCPWTTHATAPSIWAHPLQFQWVLQAPLSFQRETRGACAALVTDSSPRHGFPQNYLCISDLRCCKTK